MIFFHGKVIINDVGSVKGFLPMVSFSCIWSYCIFGKHEILQTVHS